jgi:hypothetical protein
MTIMVPTSTLERATSPRPSVFPEGTWTVELEEVRERAFPDFIADIANNPSRNGGYTSGDGDILGLQFGGARNVEGETTNQKLFLDLVVRDGNVALGNGATIPETSWQMENSAAYIAMLANAVGATEVVTGPDGQEMLAIADGFLDQLREGYFRGQRFTISTYHRNWKSKSGKEGTEVKVREITQAV